MPQSHDDADCTVKRTRRLWTRKATRRRFVPPARSVAIVLLVLGLFALLTVPFFLIGDGFGGRTVLFGLGLLMACAFGLIDNLGMRGEKMWRRTRMPLFTRLRFGRMGAAETCAFCLDAMHGSEQVVCPGCQVAYHTDCQEEMLGSCGTIGCSEQGRRVRLTDPSKATVGPSKPGKVA